MTMQTPPAPAVRTDLRPLLTRDAVDPLGTARWLSCQQLPEARRRFGLEQAARGLLLELWNRLLADLADGIVVTHSEDVREIVIARTTIIRIDPRTQELRAAIRGVAGVGEDVPFEVGQPFPRLLWLDHVLARHADLPEGIRDALFAASFVRNPVDCNHAQWVDESIRDVDAWARKCVRRRLQRALDLAALRTRVAAAFALDAGFMAIVRRAMPRAGLAVHSIFWNRCVRHRFQLERVAEHGPGLLRLLGEAIAAGAIDPEAPPLEILRKDLKRHGATALDWKRLLVDPATPVWRLRDRNCLARNTETSAHLAAWARIHRGLPAQASIPMAMWLLIARGAAQEMTNRLRVPNHFSIPRKLLLSALEAAHAHMREGTYAAFLEAEWKPFARCEPSRSQSWRKAMQNLRRDNRRAVAQAHEQSRSPWPVAVATVARGNLLAEVVATPLALHEEAIRMHNCADQFVEACHGGAVRLFHISRVGDNAAIGTLSLERACGSPPWKLADVKGPANSPVPAEVFGFARFVAQEYSNACDAVPAAEARMQSTSPVDDEELPCEVENRDSQCAICDNEEFCEEHLLATFHVEEGNLGGTIDEYWDALTGQMKDLVFAAFAEERCGTGVDGRIDELLGQLHAAGVDWRSRDPDAQDGGRSPDTAWEIESFEAAWVAVDGGNAVCSYLQEKLAKLPGVEERPYDSNTTLSWAGCHYFACDAARVAEEFAALMQTQAIACRNSLAGRAHQPPGPGANP